MILKGKAKPLENTWGQEGVITKGSFVSMYDGRKLEKGVTNTSR